MPILGAIGLGLTIFVLQVMTPAIFAETEKTVILFLRGAQVAAEVATQVAGSASALPLH